MAAGWTRCGYDIREADPIFGDSPNILRIAAADGAFMYMNRTEYDEYDDIVFAAIVGLGLDGIRERSR